MEKNDPAITVRQFVYRKIRRIVIRPLYELHLAEAAVAHRVQFLYLLDHVRSVQIHEAEGNNLRGMLLCRVRDHFSVSKRSEQTRREIQLLRHSRKSLMKLGFFSSKCTCMSTMWSVFPGD